MNKKVVDFKKASDSRLKRFREDHPDASPFIVPSFEDTRSQERMMRIGIEARATNATTEDEFYVIALATLQDDYIKNESRKA